ncbi:inhibitor of growth protein 3 [Acrodontium crateriforme]|uniref:Inhibitor of growth protein 3 n=1 Tax=Acrodontium crateriforme TaxID=150365 RepID=A0AAQ3M2M9_9PEZI|nr:inhibitor of growth protein 3 [Acrodontium crateriforme]
MPQTSNVRRAPAHGVQTGEGNPSGSGLRRTATGRVQRTNTTRPTNYYARPFGSFSAAADTSAMDDSRDLAPAGFFPAIQYFSDAVNAVPREVMRQFTLMKEVEAKIYGPGERLGELVDALSELPTPPRKSAGNGGLGNGLLSLTASNSANASAVNGVVPHSVLGDAQLSMGDSVQGEDGAHTDGENDLAKRKMFHDLRGSLANMLANLDEKNVVLAEANRVLDSQLSRIDSVWPHLENEISEDARLGSMTHWAYSDNRQKKYTTGGAAHRRDIAATNSLAAAVNAIHETELAQARRDAPTKEKPKGRGRELDSDFDDKPKKTGKLAKSKAAMLNAAGLGISTNGEPLKRRKVDKGLAAPAMERSASAATKAAKAARGSPRSTPAVEPVKKVAKAKATGPAKKKMPGSAQASPMLASSPLASTFNPASIMEPPNGRPQSAKQRQPSSTNLRHEKAMEDEISRPSSAAGKPTSKPSAKRKATDDAQNQGEIAEQKSATKTTEQAPKAEGVDDADNDKQPESRAASNSGKGGRASKNGTPRIDQSVEMNRTRSSRSRPNGHDSSSSEPQTSRHKRNFSNSHMVKQIAPFNRSPDLDRHGTGSDDDSEDGEKQREPSTEKRGRRSISRRNTLSKVAENVPSPVPSRDPSNAGDDQAMEDVAAPSPVPEEVPPLEEDVPAENGPGSQVDEDEPVEGEVEDDEDESEHDPDDPNEPKYCYCNRGSYGEMVACDNDDCPREWFHLGCTELRRAPEESESWFCVDCRPRFAPPGRRGAAKGRRGG